MASTSTLAKPASVGQPSDSIDLFDIGLDTTLLIVQLIIDDIAKVSDTRKGKNRADAPLSGEEYAFQIQREMLESSMRTIDDHRIAKNLDAALEADVPYLTAITISEQAATEDRQAALALSRGEQLPPPSRSQRQLGDAEFSIPAPPPITSPSSTYVVKNNQAVGSATKEGPGPSASKGKVRTHNSKAHSSVGTPAVSAVQSSKKQCISCGDLIIAMPSLRGDCGHDYCRDCITDLVKACTRDESLYPPRCCGQPFPYGNLVALLGPILRCTFDSKCIELDVSPNNRVYCPMPSCSTFLGSSENATGDIICHVCKTSVCLLCKQLAHSGENCSENAAMLEVRELARTERWQTCPVCKAIIELRHGCYHMTCRCRAQFCYLCAVPWKNCKCPQWDEARLIATAEHRVGQEVGNRVQPGVFQEHVRRMANTLRQNHDCGRHSWRRQDGRARCEECHYILRDFLLVCRNCALMACVRCARNRLA